LKTACIELPYGDERLAIQVPAANLLAVGAPNPAAACPDPAAEIRRALAHPIGAHPLAEAARGSASAVILADDMTRLTPVDRIVPALLDELNRAGLRDEQVTVVIALGTHRPMTEGEIAAHFGRAVVERVRVINNPWQEPAALVDLGVTPRGTPVTVSRLALEAGFLIGVGSIVPHHIPGYSGGAKIVQPGVTGAGTTGATHYLSTRAERSYLGQVENPVRAEIEEIAARVGLKAILNVVLDPAGRLVRAFYGDFVQAHRDGVAVARQVYGVPLPGLAEIVVAGSHPCDIEFWQAHKALYPAEMALKPGGTIVVVTPCPEGVSVMHPDMLAVTSLEAGRIAALIEGGQLPDVVSGALALAWARVRQNAAVNLVSGGIQPEEARALGFSPFGSVEEALASALRRHGPEARISVLTHAPDSLPLLP
jgi:nickel-dependent lactate racemase